MAHFKMKAILVELEPLKCSFFFPIIKTHIHCRKNWRVDENVQNRNFSKASHPNATAVDILVNFLPIFYELLKNIFEIVILLTCYTVDMFTCYLTLYTGTQHCFLVFSSTLYYKH